MGDLTELVTLFKVALVVATFTLITVAAVCIQELVDKYKEHKK